MPKNKGMKTNWTELKPGDFFTYKSSEHEEALLFQKLAPKDNCNAVLLNKGELWNIHPDSTLFRKVSVSIDIHEG